MEGNGTEVTQKIRSLITNKLVELGVYVDEELPDYIMVMVANKKSKIHMSDDLMLFLGNHTTLFTNWLNGILESLPSSVSDKKLKTTSPSEKSSDDATTGTLAKAQEGKVAPTEEMEEMFSFKEEETDDFLSDELNLESVAPSEERVERSQPSEERKNKKSSIQFPVLAKIAQGGNSTKLLERPRTVSGGRVAVKVRPMVQHHLAYEEEDDEYDPRNPAVGSVASVVRVTERKWSVPPALQANKLLLLKAMEDANRSVKKTGVRRPSTPVEPYQPTPIQQLTREEEIPVCVVAEEPDLRLFLKGRTEAVAPPAPLPAPPIPPRGIKRKAQQQSEISPKFVVTLDGIDPSKLVRDVVSTSERIVRDFEEDLGEGEDEEEEVVLEDRVMERCRYWPACRKGDTCTRQHPTVPCKSFPSCRYGEKCLYIHPNCRFDSRCSRKDCPYTHASKRLLPLAGNPPLILVASHSKKRQTPCKYFPNCNTPGCVYLHPKVCRFGGQCRAPSCPFSHPLPSPEKMKWVAPS